MKFLKIFQNPRLKDYNLHMILLIGASASGKTEVAKLLKSLFAIKKAVTHTSRPPRPSETDGIDYHFVSEEEFQRLYEEGKLLENTLYNGNHYGCSKAELSDDKCVILDPNGLKAFLAQNNPRLITFFLEASEQTRRERMSIRGDQPEAIEKRILNDRVTFSKENVGPTDFVIQTEGKTLEAITREIHEKYINALRKR